VKYKPTHPQLYTNCSPSQEVLLTHTSNHKHTITPTPTHTPTHTGCSSSRQSRLVVQPYPEAMAAAKASSRACKLTMILCSNARMVPPTCKGDGAHGPSRGDETHAAAVVEHMDHLVMLKHTDGAPNLEGRWSTHGSSCNASMLTHGSSSNAAMLQCSHMDHQATWIIMQCCNAAMLNMVPPAHKERPDRLVSELINPMH